MMMTIRPGTRVEVRDPTGAWFPATALSRVEGTHDYSKSGRGRRIHDVPVIWVEFEGNPRKIPWPAEDVRPVR